MNVALVLLALLPHLGWKQLQGRCVARNHLIATPRQDIRLFLFLVLPCPRCHYPPMKAWRIHTHAHVLFVYFMWLNGTLAKVDEIVLIAEGLNTEIFSVVPEQDQERKVCSPRPCSIKYHKSTITALWETSQNKQQNVVPGLCSIAYRPWRFLSISDMFVQPRFAGGKSALTVEM